MVLEICKKFFAPEFHPFSFAAYIRANSRSGIKCLFLNDFFIFFYFCLFNNYRSRLSFFRLFHLRRFRNDLLFWLICSLLNFFCLFSLGLLFDNFVLDLIGLWGSILYFNGAVGLGSISSFVLYSRKFSGPINEIANIFNEIYSALAASERIFRLLDEEEETADIIDAYSLDEVKGDVRMENVSFGYLKDRIVLHNLNLKADAGKTIAIVGPTGAGKTTIINLLMRFYDVNDGNIYVDDHETRTLTRKSLRRSYALVLQDTWLFEGTIYDNIAYGKQGATKDEVIAAAKAAHIHSFIMQLPDGYDTIIHEDGGNISKGQKQLLTIARAMLYDTNMLILDEATSNVDTNTEKEVQKAMRNLMKDKTCFVIAHRLSTIQNADLILVLEHGDVVEQGTHESLMKAHKNYYRLYASQFE